MLVELIAFAILLQLYYMYAALKPKRTPPLLQLWKLRQLVPLHLLPKRNPLQHLVSPLHLVIHHNHVMPALNGILDLPYSSIQPLLQALIRLGTSARESGTESGDVWRGEEEEDGVEGGVVGFDELDALGIDVEDAAAVLGGDGLDRGDGGAVPDIPFKISASTHRTSRADSHLTYSH